MPPVLKCQMAAGAVAIEMPAAKPLIPGGFWNPNGLHVVTVRRQNQVASSSASEKFAGAVGKAVARGEAAGRWMEWRDHPLSGSHAPSRLIDIGQYPVPRCGLKSKRNVPTKACLAPHPGIPQHGAPRRGREYFFSPGTISPYPGRTQTPAGAQNLRRYPEWVQAAMRGQCRPAPEAFGFPALLLHVGAERGERRAANHCLRSGGSGDTLCQPPAHSLT